MIPSPAEPSASVWDEHVRAVHTLSAALDRRLQEDAGVSYPEYLLLRSLAKASEKSLRTGELAECLTWEKSRVSHQVSRMESRGFVLRRECTTDARGVWVVLSLTGQQTFELANKSYTEAIRVWFSELTSEAEKRMLLAVARRISAGAHRLAKTG